MGKLAFVFPGQGSQYPGMGKWLYESGGAAREIFDMAERLRPGITDMCFQGSREELTLTDNTQPCLYCVDLAAAYALREAGVTPDTLAGFSLGELPALVFAGCLSPEDGFLLTCERGRLMAEAARETRAGMLAVMRLTDGEVAQLCEGARGVYAVNFNCPGQVVVSGAADALEDFKRRVKDAGGGATPLAAGGGFHSPFMSGAAAGFKNVLDGYIISRPDIPVYANVNALPHGEDIAGMLSAQIESPVLWSRTVTNMLNDGVDMFIECGPGKTLSGLIRRISSAARAYVCDDDASFTGTVWEVIVNAER